MEYPIIYNVERTRDGGSFTTRRVVAIQKGEPIFDMALSFHKKEKGPSHQIDMSDIPECHSYLFDERGLFPFYERIVPYQILALLSV